jgi:hypothetical protein
MKRSFSNFLVGALLLVLVAPGCDGEQSNGGNSETHFLNSCARTCDNGLECICGVCTKTCEDSAVCAVFSAAAECAPACSEAGVTGVCDLSCTADDECVAVGKTLRCSGGRCREPNASGSAGATGVGGGSGAAGVGGSAAENTGATAAGGAGDGAGGTSASGASAGEGGVTPGAGGGSAGSTEGGGMGGDAGGSGALDTNCGGAPNLEPMLVSSLELDPDTVALVAAVVGSCLPDDGVDRNAGHIWESDLALTGFYMRTHAQAECLMNARCGCAAIRHCLGVYYSAPESCNTGCSGDAFTACGPDFDLLEGYSFNVDCARVGLSCDPAGICVDGPALTCTTEGTATCNAAGQVELCENGVTRHSPVCADVGLACTDGACVGTGVACSGGFNQADQIEFVGMSCQGDLLEACVMDRTTSVDCATRGPGFHCQTLDDFAFCGLAAECVPAGPYGASPTHPASCVGDILTFCNAGRLEQVDCVGLGFTGCDVDAANSYGCTPGVQIY